jgi:hypothetical protein
MFDFNLHQFAAWQWSLLGLCAFLVGISKTGVPGFGILVVVIAAMVMPAKESVGFVLPLLIFADVFAAAWYHRKARWEHILRLITFTFVGIIAASATLDRINSHQLKPIIGVIVLVLLAVRLWSERSKLQILTYEHDNSVRQWIFAVIFGFLAGYTTMMANAAGPIMIIYLLAVGLPKYEFVGTSAWFFFIVNWLKVPFQSKLDMITAASLKVDACLFPIVLVGAVCGILLVKHIPQKLFNTVVTALAAVAALWMVISSVI